MPSYDFEDEKGERVELFLQMSEAPAWGEWGTFGGRRLKRVVEAPVEPYVPDYTCTTRINGFWDPSYPRFDEMGRGVINSKREHEELKAKSEGRIVWD
jgi:hypothetical protein